MKMLGLAEAIGPLESPARGGAADRAILNLTAYGFTSLIAWH